MARLMIGGGNYRVGEVALEEAARQQANALRQAQLFADIQQKQVENNLAVQRMQQQKQESRNSLNAQLAQMRDRQRQADREFEAGRDDALWGRSYKDRLFGAEREDRATDVGFRDRDFGLREKDFGLREKDMGWRAEDRLTAINDKRDATQERNRLLGMQLLGREESSEVAPLERMQRETADPALREEIQREIDNVRAKYTQKLRGFMGGFGDQTPPVPPDMPSGPEQFGPPKPAMSWAAKVAEAENRRKETEKQAALNAGIEKENRARTEARSRAEFENRLGVVQDELKTAEKLFGAGSPEYNAIRNELMGLSVAYKANDKMPVESDDAAAARSAMASQFKTEQGSKTDSQLQRLENLKLDAQRTHANQVKNISATAAKQYVETALKDRPPEVKEAVLEQNPTYKFMADAERETVRMAPEAALSQIQWNLSEMKQRAGQEKHAKLGVNVGELELFMRQMEVKLRDQINKKKLDASIAAGGQYGKASRAMDEAYKFRDPMTGQLQNAKQNAIANALGGDEWYTRFREQQKRRLLN